MNESCQQQFYFIGQTLKLLVNVAEHASTSTSHLVLLVLVGDAFILSLSVAMIPSGILMFLQKCSCCLLSVSGIGKWLNGKAVEAYYHLC